ncbi:ABC transporter permease, partial [Turicibacter sanguinis]|nr:ABC transporter permease [Turicibacter sanguinis]
MMKKQINGTPGYQKYLKDRKKEAFNIHFLQIFLLVAFLIFWEVGAQLGFIDDFLFSKPSAVWNILVKYVSNGEIFKHLGIS